MQCQIPNTLPVRSEYHYVDEFHFVDNDRHENFLRNPNI